EYGSERRTFGPETVGGPAGQRVEIDGDLPSRLERAARVLDGFPYGGDDRLPAPSAHEVGEGRLFDDRMDCRELPQPGLRHRSRPTVAAGLADLSPSRRTSPSRTVSPIRSSYSPRGTEYFRVVPSKSRSSAIVMLDPSASRSTTRRRSSAATSESR